MSFDLLGAAINILLFYMLFIHKKKCYPFFFLPGLTGF